MPVLTPNYGFNQPLVNNATDADLWGGQLNTNWGSLDTTLLTVQNATPVGVFYPYGGSSTPTGFLLCYGQDVDRTTFADLFAVFGTTYGVGDGSTTFGIPDLRGRVIAGKDDMGGVAANRLTNQSGGVDGLTLGASGGDEDHALIEAELAPHFHTHNAAASNNVGGGGTLNDIVANGAGSFNTSSTGSGDAHNNVQPTLIANYIVKT